MNGRAAAARAWLFLALRVFLGGLFVYASIHKLRDPVSFSKIIYGYKILSPWAINLLAIALPGVELVAGVFLLAGFLSRGAALTIAATLMVFIWALGFNIARGLDFDCGCFSFARSKPGAAVDLLLRDLVLFAVSIGLLIARETIWSLDGLRRPR